MKGSSVVDDCLALDLSYFYIVPAAPAKVRSPLYVYLQSAANELSLTSIPIWFFFDFIPVERRTLL